MASCKSLAPAFFKATARSFTLLLRFPATASLLRGPHWQAANRLLRLFSKPQRALSAAPPFPRHSFAFAGAPLASCISLAPAFFKATARSFTLLLRFPATASLLRGPHWQAANRLLRLFSKPQRALLRCSSVSPPQLRFCGGPIGKLHIACSGFFQSHSALFYAAPPFPRHSFAFAGAPLASCKSLAPAFFKATARSFTLLLRFPATASLLRGPHWQAANRLLRLFSKPQRALLRCPSVSPPQLRFCGGPIRYFTAYIKRRRMPVCIQHPCAALAPPGQCRDKRPLRFRKRGPEPESHCAAMPQPDYKYRHGQVGFTYKLSVYYTKILLSADRRRDILFLKKYRRSVVLWTYPEKSTPSRSLNGRHG